MDMQEIIFFQKKLAIEATQGLQTQLKQKKEAETRKKEKEIEQAKELAKKIEGLTLEIKVKAGENGKLFGAITNKEIADELKKQFNIDVEKKKIELDTPLKNIGSYTVDVKVYPSVSAKLKTILVRMV